MNEVTRHVPSASVCRVALVDDHSVVRAGLRFILEDEPGVEIVGEAGTADEAIELIARTQPDIIFMDISLPDGNGLDLTKRIRRAHPETRVIILTLHEDEEYFMKALQAEAAGYVIKGSPAEDLLAALHSVSEGGTYLHPKVAGNLVARYLEQRGEVAFKDLSDREREVAEMIVEGLSNREIALRLSIRPTTVQTHRSHVMAKLGLRDYGELIRYAIRHGVIDP